MALNTFLRLKEDKQKLIIHHALKEFSERSYQDANTDEIIKNCNISKGSLYHYFGSKKQLYLFLLSHCLEIFRNAAKANPQPGEDFYGTLFFGLDKKLSLYQTHPLEIAFITMAAKEQSQEVFQEKQNLLLDAFKDTEAQFYLTLRHSVSTLPLKKGYDLNTVLKGLIIYIEALRNKYLEAYRLKPMDFYGDREKVKAEFKGYVDLFLYGILREEEVE